MSLPGGSAPAAVTIEEERNQVLLAWYADHRRKFPWRETRDPYLILVSEVMLQQTPADRVVPFYKRFIKLFPSADALMNASLADVLGAWSGLGYNTRAKRLQEAARSIVVSGWPETVEGFEELPGVGPYTARAVTCFALGEEMVPVDTNIRRVLSRWHGEALDGPALQTIADTDVGGAGASGWTQAIMDLSAAVCRPRSPRCDVCPVSSWCAGPGTYTPPRPQARFEGSARQVRGAVIRLLVAGPALLPELTLETGFAESAVKEALGDLESEGLVEETDTGFRLPD